MRKKPQYLEEKNLTGIGERMIEIEATHNQGKLCSENSK